MMSPTPSTFSKAKRCTNSVSFIRKKLNGLYKIMKIKSKQIFLNLLTNFVHKILPSVFISLSEPSVE